MSRYISKNYQNLNDDSKLIFNSYSGARSIEKNDNRLQIGTQENIGAMRGDIKRLRQVSA